MDSIETILAATSDDADFDLTDSLIQIEEVSETFELLESEDGTVDLEAAANLAKNANEIEESKQLLTAAKDEQKLNSGEITDLKNLDVKKDIKEQKAINKAVEDQKKSVEKQRQERNNLLKKLFPLNSLLL